MTSPTDTFENPSGKANLLGLSDDDRTRLGDALQQLIAHGSIIRLESGKSALYHWVRQYFYW